jgi:hypothetical protein
MMGLQLNYTTSASRGCKKTGSPARHAVMLAALVAAIWAGGSGTATGNRWAGGDPGGQKHDCNCNSVVQNYVCPTGDGGNTCPGTYNKLIGTLAMYYPPKSGTACVNALGGPPGCGQVSYSTTPDPLGCNQPIE